MELTTFQVNNVNDSLKIMKNICLKYFTDLKFSELSLEDAYKYCQQKYAREKEETFMRPDVFKKIGGDCDDQTIFITCLLLCRGVPEDKIIWVICGQNRYTHIFLIYNQGQKMFFDMLPDRSFNALRHYPVYKEILFSDI